MKSATLAMGLVVSAGLAIVSPAFGQLGLAPVGDDPGTSLSSAPELQISKESHQFGEIDDTQPVTTKFAFRNAGSAPLTIASVRGSCGCTVPALSKMTYEPGESGEFTVTFNPHHKKGSQTQTVTIQSNDPKMPTRQVTILANVNPSVSVEPQENVPFGEMVKGTGSTKTVTIRSRVPGLKIEGPVSVNRPESLQVKLGAAKEIEPGVMLTEVELVIPPDAPVGPLAAMATIRTSEATRVINLNAMGNVVGDIMVNPPLIQLQSKTVNESFESTVKVTARNGKAFKLLSGEDVPMKGIDRPAFAVEIAEDPAGGYVVKLRGQAPDKPMALNGEVVLKTDMGDEPEVRVRYFGFTRAPASGAAGTALPGVATQPAGGPGVAVMGK